MHSKTLGIALIAFAGLATLSGAPSTLAAAVRHLALARLPLSE